MATLFNTKISQTYQGLLKTIDNAVLNATLRELTDGSGNQSGLYLNNAGDFKVTAILEWGSLKDTGTGVTITQFVTAANGIQNFNNDTTVPTSAAVKLYVDTKFSQTDTLQEVLTFGNTTSGTDIAVSANDDITFTDSSKILMGASSDLQIYHDGSNSFIEDTGTGSLRVSSNAFRIYNAAKSEFLATFNEGSSVDLYYNNTKRFETTTDGSKVTGNLVVTGTITGSGGSFLPLAGGTMTGNIDLGDNIKAQFGTSQDLKIYHDGSHSYIQDSGTGVLKILGSGVTVQNSAGTENMLVITPNGSVDLYYDNSKKFETTSAGVTIIGDLLINTTGGYFEVDVSDNSVKFADNTKAKFGTSGDLEIYHDGSNSYISDTGTGNLEIKSDFINVTSVAGETMATFNDNNAVSLYFNNVKRLETITDGAKVTGNLEVTGTITGSGGSFLPLAGGTMTGNTIHNDNVKSIYGTSSDGLEIFHDGGHSYITDTGTGSLFIQADASLNFKSNSQNENWITATSNGKVDLWYNGSRKFETTNTGVSVTGDLFADGLIVGSNEFIKLGDGNQFTLVYDNTDAKLQTTSGDLRIDQAAVTKSIIFRVSNANALDTTALTINREGDLTTGADVTIAGNLTVNGTTTTINTQTLAVEDPLIELAKDNSANSLDIGFYGKYNDGTARYLGLFADASDTNRFKLFKGTTAQPTTTVDTGGTGYEYANLLLNEIEARGDLKVEDNIYITDATTTRAKIQLNSSDRDNLDIKAVSLGSTMSFYTVDTLALSLDASQNAQFANAVLLADNKKLEFGGSGDLKIYHSAGSDSYIQATTGHLNIVNYADDKDIKFWSDDGSGGVEVYFQLEGVSGGGSPFTVFPDNSNLVLGSGHDLRIYHNGTGSYVDNYTGVLQFTNYADDSDIILRTDDGSGGTTQYFRADGSTGASVLYHLGSEKFATTSTGVEVTGNIDLADGATRSIIGPTNSNLIIEAKPNQATEGLFLQINGTDKLSIFQDGNATFAGTITSGAHLINASSSAFGGSSVQGVNTDFLIDTGQGYARFNSYYTGGGNIQFLTNAASSTTNSVALTLDSSQNATFAGTIIYNGAIRSTTPASKLILSNSSTTTELHSAGSGGTIFKNSGNNPILTLDSNNNAIFAGNVTSTATSFVQTFNVTDNSTFFNINHTGNEAWQFKCESLSGSNDAITIGTSGGTIEIDEAGQIFSHQKLDVATAGGRLTGKSNRGYLASIHLEQVATGADGGEFYVMTAPNGTTAGTRKLEISSAGEVTLGTGTNNAGFLDFDSTNLQFNTQRNPNTGAFVDTNKSHAHIGLQGANGGSQIIFGTAAANNTVATTRMTITKDGFVGIGTGASAPENKLHVKSNTSNTTPQVLVQNGSTGDASIKFNVSGQSYVAGIDYDDSKKFKIASSSNLGTTDRITILSGGQVGINTINPVDTLEVAGNIRANISNGGGFMITAASASGLVRNNGTGIALRTNTTDRLVVDSGGKVTISQELVAMDIKYSNYSVGSLDTTGVTVGSVTGAGNGSSAIIEFVGSGGIDGLVDVVFHCVNDSGNWTAYKNSRQTAKKVDVDVSGNGTGTLTFTFKSLSGSQSYTPRLMRKGSPTALITF